MNIYLLYFYRLLTCWWPETPKLYPLKRMLLRCCGVEVGKNVVIASSVYITGQGKLVLKDGVRLAHNVQIFCQGEIVLGENVVIAENNVIGAAGRIEIGRGTEIYQSNLLMANGKSSLVIGEDCQIAHMVSLKTTHHEINPAGRCIGGAPLFSDIRIGNGCWICACATIIPGVTVGERVIVGAGAVVISDVPAYSLAVGVPAVIKKAYQ